MSVAILVLLLAPEVNTSAISVAAQASARPAECRSITRLGGKTLWDHAREPETGRYCRLLAWGHAVLESDPLTAQRHAKAALKLRPQAEAARLLLARALLRNREGKRAWSTFLALRAGKAKGMGAPEVLHDFAIAAFQTGEMKSSAAAYRQLIPRLALMSSPRRRQRAALEAGLTLMSASKKGGKEALSFLSAVRRRITLPGYRDLLAGALALALEREGRKDAARGVLAETRGPWAALRKLRRDKSLVAPAGELSAVVAMLARGHDRELEQLSWRKAVAAGGPWNDHARRMLELTGR